MADALDLSDLGAPVSLLGAAVGSSAPVNAAPAPVAPVPGGPDLSSLGTHAVAGPSGDFWSDLKTRLGSAGTDALAGLLATPRSLGDATDWLGRRAGVKLGVSDAMGQVPGGNGLPLFPQYDQARDMAYNTTGATEYVPQTPLGRMGQAAMTGALMGLTNPVSIPAAAGASAAAQGAGELGVGLPARIAAGVLGGGLTGAAANTAMRGASAAAGAGLTPTAAAYDRLGLPMNLAGDVTGNPTLQFLQTFAAKMPGGEHAVDAARQKVIQAWQGALDRTAGSLGNATTAQEAGQSLQSSAQQWVQGFQQAQNGAWNDFFKLLPGNTQTSVSNFRQALDAVTSGYGGAQNLASVMQPQLAARLKAALAADTGANGTLPWATIQQLRSDLGERLSGAQVLDGNEMATIKRLYAGLSDDMVTGAAMQGAPAVAAYAKANAMTAAGHQVLDDYLRPILNQTDPEKATQWALATARFGNSRLAALFGQLGQMPGNGPQDLASYAAQSMAGADSPTAFASSLLGAGAKRPALSPEAQQTLFGPQMQAMQDLATAGRSMANTERQAGNTSNTSAHASRGLGALMTGMEMAREGRDMAGLPGAVGGFALGAATPGIMGRMAGALGVNPALARFYATQTPMQFTAPGYLARLPLSFGLPTQAGSSQGGS